MKLKLLMLISLVCLKVQANEAFIAAPEANFSITTTIYCVDEIMTLTDTSTNTPTTWQWVFSPATVSFENGTDANTQNPQIKFNASGNYQIALTVSNTDGSHTVTKSINIVGKLTAPMSETFTTSVPPTNWSILNPDGLETWEAVQVTGIGGNPTQVARMDNYSYNAVGQKDELVMPAVDLSSMVNPILKFEVAYASYNASNSERLHIEFSTDCGVTFNATTYDKAGSVLETHPSSTSGWGPTSGSHWRTETIPLSAYNSTNTIFKFIQTNGYGNGLFIDDVRIEEVPIVKMSPKVFLQGALLNPNVGEETLMRDDLRVGGLIPTTSPYSDGKTINTSLLTATGNDAIVDWIWVEIRDATNSMTVVQGQSALLQRDGDVVSIVDGTSPVIFNRLSANYYIVVKHRNHLGIMTANAIALYNTNTVVDFTDANNQITFGTNAQTTFGMPSGVIGMWAGNVNGDDVVQYSGIIPDPSSVLSEVLNDSGNFLNFPTYVVNGYNSHDINMDGSIQYSGVLPDTPIVLQNILVHPGNFLNFSTYQIQVQLP